MKNCDKETLISSILPYSKIDASDLDRIRQSRFRHNVVTKLNTVTLEFKCVPNPQKDNFICKIFIQSNTKGNYTMENFLTNHHKNIWNRYLGYKTTNKLREIPIENKLSQEELRDLIKGTKLYRRLSSQTITEISSINSDSDENDDPDYIPNEEISEFSDYNEDSELEIDNISTHNTSNISTSSSGCSCIRSILDELKKNC